MWSLWGSQQPFSRVLGLFWHGEEVADAVEMVDVNKEGVVNNDTKRIKCFGFKVNLTYVSSKRLFPHVIFATWCPYFLDPIAPESHVTGWPDSLPPRWWIPENTWPPLLHISGINPECCINIILTLINFHWSTMKKWGYECFIIPTQLIVDLFYPPPSPH